MDSTVATRALPPEAAAGGSRRRVRLVVNPVAGRRNPSLVQGVVEALRGRGLEVELRETGGPGDAWALARDARRESLNGAAPDLLVVAGGDGTINEAANGLVEANLVGANLVGANLVGANLVGAGRDGALPMAIIPLGTANVLAHEIGLKSRASRVAEAILSGPARRVSIGRAHAEDAAPRCFILMAGVGFDAHVVEGVDLGLKRRIGKGAYVWAGLRQIFGFDFPDYRITIDGRAFSGSSAIIANARSYAGPYIAAPDASLASPGFQVLLFKRAGALAVARGAVALFNDALHRLPEVTLIEGRKIRIEGPAGDPVQGDGDTLARLPVEIEMLPEALDLVMPAAA